MNSDYSHNPLTEVALALSMAFFALMVLTIFALSQKQFKSIESDKISINSKSSIIKDKKRILPCAAYLNGEYGVSGFYIGVPVIIGKEGAEKVIEVKLNSDEKKMFVKSVKSVKNLITIVKKIKNNL